MKKTHSTILFGLALLSLSLPSARSAASEEDACPALAGRFEHCEERYSAHGEWHATPKTRLSIAKRFKVHSHYRDESTGEWRSQLLIDASPDGYLRPVREEYPRSWQVARCKNGVLTVNRFTEEHTFPGDAPAGRYFERFDLSADATGNLRWLTSSHYEKSTEAPSVRELVCLRR